MLDEAPISMQLRRIVRLFKVQIERFFGVTYFNRCFSQIDPHSREYPFAEAIEAFQLKYSAISVDKPGIPQNGAFIIVCNHPHGIWDGVIVGNLLTSIRSDTKIVAHYLCKGLSGFKNLFIPVDPRSNRKGCELNRNARFLISEQLASGKPLVIFPAGQVSRFNLRNFSTTDSAWGSLPIELATQFNVPIIPLFIAGRNSWMYQLATIYRTTFANALLVREFRLMAGKSGRVVVGTAISPNDLEQFDGPFAKTRYIREQTYALSVFS